MSEKVYVMGDLYNSLFSVQVSNPDYLVDYKLWNQIRAGLPDNYRMPDPVIQHILNSHPNG
ncbi:hypothetical protein [Paenibacillus sp. UNC499MF]|uniref:hypothetical protein n=1 Tax=unclassified Paenibacillus TaxID=185978 RepID=UPI0008A035EF|nr:hypothetical protein [Paenibacillus sp. UNC499MF]SEG36395.1 hypothetical protein SAMN02799616_02664 [Paenibacillus sp. UNC499MF]